MCDALLPHSRPRPILPVAKRVRFGDDIPPHAPLASPAWDPGSSVRMPQNALPSVPSTLLPFAAPPQVCRLYRWSRLHSVWWRGSRCPACLAGSRAQIDSATRFSSPGDLPSSTAFSRRWWQSGTPLSCARRLLSSWQRMQSSRSLQPRWGRGFTALTSSYPRKVVAFGQSWISESWTGLYTSSRSRCWRTGAWSNAFSPRIGLQRSTWRTLTFTFRSFRWTKMNDSLLVIRKGAVLVNESVMSNFSEFSEIPSELCMICWHRTKNAWWRERRRYVPMPQSWTIAGCQGLSLLGVKPNQWTHLSPFYTRMHGEWLRYAKSTSQFHWRFLLSQRWLGLPSKSPMSSRHNVSVPSIRERGLRT